MKKRLYTVKALFGAWFMGFVTVPIIINIIDNNISLAIRVSFGLLAGILMIFSSRVEDTFND